ncbi:hypothetical protein [Sutcliffiella halmapala]|nr:hypothetical protein [Sutcliffiella halmapala]
MTTGKDNRKRSNKYSNNYNDVEIAKESSGIQQDPTPEENEKYGSKSHKN